MNPPTKISLFPLFLLISFASVNAVLFTPGLPQIATFFGIPDDDAQRTLSWFLIGYSLGQLIYGPLTNRFGKKPTLYIGIGLQIFSSFLCIFSKDFDSFSLLLVGRFLLAIGSGVGLKITFTLVNEYFSPSEAAQKIAYLMIAFAITPGLAVAVGGILASHFGWQSCFYLGALYGLGILLFIPSLPYEEKALNRSALKIRTIFEGYVTQFMNKRLVAGGLLMGLTTSFIYVYAAVAPFVAIKLFNMTPAHYGIATFLPSVGLLLGSLSSAQLSKRYLLNQVIQWGMFFILIVAFIMLMNVFFFPSPWLILFLPMMFCYFGLALILANASSIAMQSVENKANGSAVMNFINMGTATLAVFSLNYFPTTLFLLPIIFLGLTLFMLLIFQWVR